MKILILSQVFHPDVVAVAQYASDLGRELSAAQHEVTVLSSRRAYDSPQTLYPAQENWNGVDIRRVKGTGFGKGSLAFRAFDFASVTAIYALRLLTMPRQDAVVALTVPPLVSFLAALFKVIRGGRLVIWVMDLNPDQAIAAGILRDGSIVARVLKGMLAFSTRHADAVVVLDRFMKERLEAKGVDPNCIYVAPLWAQDTNLAYNAAGREAFRQRHGLTGKFVVMYSGNHSPCHPLTTILEAARRLSHRPEIAFAFVGGGTEQANCAAFAAEHGLTNIHCLPYQPIGELSGSLSAADLHTVVLGDPYVGIVHPSKIYNILKLGIPFLFVGPSQSHVSELTPSDARGDWGFFATHGDVDAAVKAIEVCAGRGAFRAPEAVAVAARFSEANLIPPLVDIIEASDRELAGRSAGVSIG